MESLLYFDEVMDFDTVCSEDEPDDGDKPNSKKGKLPRNFHKTVSVSE